MRQSGFTLLELSIVLVIIGLIIGGVTVGAELIRHAELKSAMKQVDELDIAITTFKLKYRYVPGDLPNNDYFTARPDFVANMHGHPTRGDGSGNMTSTGSAFEEGYFWQHLHWSELYANNVCLPYCPYSNHLLKAKMTSLWLWADSTSFARDILVSPVPYIDAISLTNGPSYTAAKAPIHPRDAKMMDEKWDDGFPRSGRVSSRNNGTMAYDCGQLVGSKYHYKVDVDDAACWVRKAFTGAVFN